LVSLSNGKLRIVSNLSRDWSQAFVDIAVAAGMPLEKTLQALESAAAGLRSDAAWSQALVDGPRVLGLQGYDQTGPTVRLQVRTAPTRQDEVCRELRRRIQMELQREGIAVAKPGGVTDA
jgi:small-conductance mechanosensitive channel